MAKQLNKEWAIEELKKFMEQISGDSSSRQRQESSSEILGQLHVIDNILDRVVPGWRQNNIVSHPLELLNSSDWIRQKRAVPGAITALEREQELAENLGDLAPAISAAALHPWVWTGAQSLWQSGHYRSAVEDALRKVNAETQNKVGRRDLSEAKLFIDCFSNDPAKPDVPRLRRMENDGTQTYRSLQAGARGLAEGIYAGIRNPLSHGEPTDLSDQIALEYLAALSVLARWVDEAAVEVSPPESAEPSFDPTIKVSSEISS